LTEPPGNTANDADALHMVDVFGFETEMVTMVDDAA
jgi:hypothetical protein